MRATYPLFVDEFISQLYRAIGQVPLADYRLWALETLRPLIHFDGAIWGTGHINTGEFYTHTRLDISEQLYTDLVKSRPLNPIYQNVSSHLIEPLLSGQAVPEGAARLLGKPMTMDDFIGDEEFYASTLYEEYFKPYNIERILSSFHADERSGIFTLLSLYRFDRDNKFTQVEKDTQQHLLFHLISAASHAYFIELQKRHKDTITAHALCDKHGNYHEVERPFLDLIDAWFGESARKRLPFSIPEKQTIIEGLYIESEVVGELFRIGIRPQQALDKLTRREQEVVQGICTGLTFKTIARDLSLSPSTVSNHLYRVYRKLGINSRSELVSLLDNSNT